MLTQKPIHRLTSLMPAEWKIARWLLATIAFCVTAFGAGLVQERSLFVDVPWFGGSPRLLATPAVFTAIGVVVYRALSKPLGTAILLAALGGWVMTAYLLIPLPAA